MKNIWLTVGWILLVIVLGATVVITKKSDSWEVDWLNQPAVYRQPSIQTLAIHNSGTDEINFILQDVSLDQTWPVTWTTASGVLYPNHTVEIPVTMIAEEFDWQVRITARVLISNVVSDVSAAVIIVPPDPDRECQQCRIFNQQAAQPGTYCVVNPGETLITGSDVWINYQGFGWQKITGYGGVHQSEIVGPKLVYAHYGASFEPKMFYAYLPLVGK